MEIAFSKNQKAFARDLTETKQAAKFIKIARLYSAVFRANSKRELFPSHSRKLPTAPLEQLREHQKEVKEKVIHSLASFVWSVRVDNVNCRVIDPERSTQATFENSMQRQFGTERVQSCRRLWPPEETR